jgi:DNA-directed RNA polymerase specialized sigma24 family protein
MHRDRAVDELPETYACALRLREAGMDDVAIADRLGLEPAAVGPLLQIGTAKLDAILVDAGATDELG